MDGNGNATYIEPFAVPETFADDIECEIKDGIFYLTFLREMGGERIAVHRAIMSVKRFLEMRKKTGAALVASEPPNNLVHLVG